MNVPLFFSLLGKTLNANNKKRRRHASSFSLKKKHKIHCRHGIIENRSTRNKRRSIIWDTFVKNILQSIYKNFSYNFLRNLVEGCESPNLSLKLESLEETFWIILCVKSVDYSIIVNGYAVGAIIPSKGIRWRNHFFCILFMNNATYSDICYPKCIAKQTWLATRTTILLFSTNYGC